MMDDLSVVAVESLIDEFVDPKKLTSDHLESLSGRLSWGFTTDEHRESMKGKEATNDNSERWVFIPSQAFWPTREIFYVARTCA